MMARFLALLIVLATAPVLASVEFGARLEQANWALASAPDACELIHRIPRYGVARFHAHSGHPLEFRVDTDLSGASGRPARLYLVAPSWRHDLRSRLLAEVASDSARISLERHASLELYHGLEAGYQVSLEHVSPGQGGFRTAAAISPIRFRDVSEGFQQCRDRMIQLDFQPVADWQVFFDTNQSRLDGRAHATLRRVLSEWQQRRDLRVIIGGHADERGGDVINDPLSRRRADAVRAFLDVYGVPRNRIEVRSFGSAWPLDPGDGEEAWSRNRRATVWLAP